MLFTERVKKTNAPDLYDQERSFYSNYELSENRFYQNFNYLCYEYNSFFLFDTNVRNI